MPGGNIDLNALAKAASVGGRARAPIIVWMCDHHDEFAAILTRQGVNWTRIAAFFADAGYTGARGEILIPETVRSYWKRARKIVAAQRKRARNQPAPPAAITPDSPSTATAPTEPKFKLARARDEHLWGTQAPATVTPKPPQPPNPAYAGLSHEQIVEKVLGRKPKEPPK